MSGEVPEFDVSRILFLVSLRQAENKGCFKKQQQKMHFFFKKKSYQTISDEDF